MRTYRDGAVGSAPASGTGAGLAPGKQTLVEATYGGGLPKTSTGRDGVAPDEVVVTASSLRVRSSPDTSSKANVLGKLHEGDRVPTVGKEGNWLVTPYAGTQGYISGKYTRPATLLDDVDTWLRLFIGGDDPAHEPAEPTVDPAKPAEPDGPEAPPPPVTPGKPPTGVAALSDPAFAAYLATLGDARVDAAAHAVAGCQQASAALAENLDAHEEKGADRDALVAALGPARAAVAALDDTGFDAVTLAYIKPTLYRMLTACAPYYSQGRNIDVLETKGDTRTCNLTSIAMVLEGLGKSANDYTGPRDKVLAVAAYTPYAPRVAGAGGRVKGATGDWGKLAALRLPDFLQLAAIAECMSGGTSDAEILAAAQSAWGRIVHEFTILRHIAQRFGVGGTERSLENGLSKPLGSITKSARKKVQEMVDARNDAEASGDAGDQARYEKLRDGNATALAGDKIEDKVPLETYRDTVLANIGAELDRGAGVFMLMAHHYARVQSVSETHVVVDDPGRDWRSGQRVLWEEARAMAYFKKRIVFE